MGIWDRFRNRASDPPVDSHHDDPFDDEPDESEADVREGLARKDQSEAVLREIGIPINSWLPRLEAEAQSNRRSTNEVAERALALMAVAVTGEGHLNEPPEAVRELAATVVEACRLDTEFTPSERAFMEEFEPSRHDAVQFIWRYEALWVLHWTLGFVEHLDPPSAICDVPKAVRLIRDRGRDGYLEDAALRPQGEILDQADLIYRYHWAARDAHLKGSSVPGLDHGVIVERHHALNWLRQDELWDFISKDT